MISRRIQLAQGRTAVCSCKNSNEPSCSIQGEEFLEEMSDYQFLFFFSATANWLVTRSRLLGCKHLQSPISAKIYFVSRLWLVVPNVTASYGLQKPRGVEWHRSTPCSSTECFLQASVICFTAALIQQIWQDWDNQKWFRCGRTAKEGMGFRTEDSQFKTKLKRKNRFCRRSDIKRVTWFTLQPRSATPKTADN